MSILVLCDAMCAVSIFPPSSQFMQNSTEAEEELKEQEEGEASNLGPVYMFITGLTIARFGLHLFDLCLIQLFQEGVRHPH